MYNSCKQVSEFSLEGEILGLIFQDGCKLKYLRISSDRGIEYLVKLCKELRDSIGQGLRQGLKVKVAGEKEINLKNGKIKHKARSLQLAIETPDRKQLDLTNTRHISELERAIATSTTNCSTALQAAKAPAKTKAKILVCQKSDCQKRGGAAICKALENALNSRGLEGKVTVQGTGCLKQCKAGPNIVLMPDKTRYSRIAPTEIPALIEKHFAAVKA
ncbi:MAG: (2Fe-2S) ferredoxin domain-containing protein [Oscillatoriaceae cyanobacterium Prado104]|jgi:(2Fe-2S) ferredoxin|nr:(2Fe-2S) ferredoxin domain-containing protein [Oscillatoriaceae cyanobacterium Prado104]